MLKSYDIIQNKNRLFGLDIYTIILFCLSALIVIIWFSTQHIGFTSDSTTYVHLAEYLVRKRSASSMLFIRTPGYPFLVILGAVPFLHSFAGLLMIQALMAIFTPILIYKTLLLIVPRVAFTGGVLSIFSLLPFVYSKAIMTEHAFIFTLTALIYLMTLYNQKPKISYLYTTTTCLIFLTFLRPSANFIFVIVFVFCFFVTTKNYKQLIKCIAMFLIATSAWSTFVGLQVNPSIAGNVTDRLKQMLFYHIYSNNTSQQNNIKPENGPASEQLFNHLKKFTVDHPDAWALRTPASRFTKFRESPDKFIDAIYQEPNPNYYTLILNVIDARHTEMGIKNPSTIPFLHGVAWEAISQKPSFLGSFLWKTFFSSAKSFAGQQLFYQIYVASPAISLHTRIFSPGIGPASKKLVDTAKNFIYDYPQFWEDNIVFSKYKGNPEKMLQEQILVDANINSYWFLWSLMDTMYSPIESANVFLEAALEGFNHNPISFNVPIENFIGFFFGPPMGYINGSVATFKPTAHTLHWWDDPGLPEYYKNELKSGLRLFDKSIYHDNIFWTFWGYIWLFIKPFIFVLLLLTYLFSAKTGYFKLITTMVMILIYQGLITSLFAEPLPRYIDQIMLLTITVTLASSAFAYQKLKLVLQKDKKEYRSVNFLAVTSETMPSVLN